MGNRVKDKVKKKSIKAAKSASMGSKRKLSRMGKKQKTGNAGLQATYLSRSSVLKRLQLTLKDFRRLCILKGIYPRHPGKAPGDKKGQTFYHVKDVQYLSHEPLLIKFREFKAYMKKVRKSSGRGDTEHAARLNAEAEQYTLHHLVKERYPRFVDALEDLDDCLSLIHLFACLPAGKVKAEIIEKCKVLVDGWSASVLLHDGVTSTFVSVKGVYHEASVHGVSVRWLVPHSYTQNVPADVDLKVMLTFLDFYTTMADFVVFKAMQEKGARWPRVRKEGEGLASMLEGVVDSDVAGRIAGNAANKKAEATSKVRKGAGRTLPARIVEGAGEEDEDVEDEMRMARDSAFADDDANDAAADNVGDFGGVADGSSALFSGLVFFVGRECPLPLLSLVSLSHGATVAWEGPLSPLKADDSRITHYICDRPAPTAAMKSHPSNREVVQPQWAIDSANFRYVLPASRYALGANLPPHLSPWQEDGYVPKWRQEVEAMKKGVEFVDSDDETEGEEEGGRDGVKEAGEGGVSDSDEDEGDSPANDNDNDADLAKSMMSKKAKRLYGRMQYGIDKRQGAIDELTRKRKEIKKREREEEEEEEEKSVDVASSSKKPRIEIVYSDDEDDDKDSSKANGHPKINKRHQCIGGKGKKDGKSAGAQKVDRLKAERKQKEKEFSKPVGMVDPKSKKKKRKKA